MFTDNKPTNEDQPSYPLFNFEALKNMADQSIPHNMISPSSVAIFNDKSFLKKDTDFNQNIEIVAKKRGRKPKKQPTKDINDKDITIKEIIEDQQSGIPTADEIIKKEEKIRKMREGRAKKSLKENSDDQGARARSSAALPRPAESQEGTKPQSAFGNSLVPRIVLRDGKPVIEAPVMDLVKFDPIKQNQLVEVKKPQKLTSLSFKSRVHTEKWTPEENRKFFKALQIFGSDFGMISKLFKNRTRNQIKNKFHKEEKQNAIKIDAALNKHKKFNFRTMNDKINALNNAMIKEYDKKAPQNAIENQHETRLERFEKVDNISRNNSASSSVDSMDLSIMNEIQDIFNSEIELIRNKNKNPVPLFLPPMSGKPLTIGQNMATGLTNEDNKNMMIGHQPHKLDLSLL